PVLRSFYSGGMLWGNRLASCRRFRHGIFVVLRIMRFLGSSVSTHSTPFLIILIQRALPALSSYADGLYRTARARANLFASRRATSMEFVRRKRIKRYPYDRAMTVPL